MPTCSLHSRSWGHWETMQFHLPSAQEASLSLACLSPLFTPLLWHLLLLHCSSCVLAATPLGCVLCAKGPWESNHCSGTLSSGKRGWHLSFKCPEKLILSKWVQRSAGVQAVAFYVAPFSSSTSEKFFFFFFFPVEEWVLEFFHFILVPQSHMTLLSSRDTSTKT